MLVCEMSALMYLCHLELSAGSGVWDPGDTAQMFHYCFGLSCRFSNDTRLRDMPLEWH